MKPPITVLIPCKNEVHHIAACIASAKPIADEILIADSGSTDGTLELVRSLGDYRIIEREYVHSADFKNWAIPQAKNDWILVLDADERLTPELREEILTLFADGSPPQDGYRVRFAPYFLGRPIRHCGWNTTTSIRLFRRSVGRYSTRRVHADVIVESGKVGMLHHKIEHYTCTSLERWMEKRNRYTERGAEELFAAGRKVSPLELFFRPCFHFFKSYVLRAGFLDGTAGLIVCLDDAFSAFLKYAKLWEKHETIRRRQADAETNHQAVRRPYFAARSEAEKTSGR